MFILGIDLRNDYSQVCYYNMSKGEPESVSFKLAASDLRVPTVVLREYENVSGWMAGEVAVSCSALGEGVLFDREYQDCLPQLQEMKDKTIVEYHTRGGVRARIHYVMMHENGQAEDYLSEYMQEVYSGVFFKEFVLFFGENLQYYIMEESENEEQLTESGSLQKSDIMNESPDSKYEIINDMMISMTLQDDTTLDHLIEEYYRREYLDHRLFTLQ